MAIELINAKTKAGLDSALASGSVKQTDLALVRETGEEALHTQDKTYHFVPGGGHERQILAWDEEGKAKWDDLANIFTGLEELLAYGVEWKENVADPHLTRIGNMTLHKTLPIQSQLKGCIAQGSKVMYWLDENDWNFKSGGKNNNNASLYLLGDTVSETPGATITFTDLGEVIVNIPLSAQITVPYKEGDVLKVHALNDPNNVAYYIDVLEFTNTAENASIKLKYRVAPTYTVDYYYDEIYSLTPDNIVIDAYGTPARLDGYDGTVRVYCPSFYIKSEIIGDTRRVWISAVKIDDTWTFQPELLIDAYRSTVLNTVPENMGYLSTLPVNSAISVVNTAAYCRGGNNRTAYDKYLKGVEASEGVEAVAKDIFRTDLGKPRTNHPRSSMRTEARNAGSEMLSYDQYKNIFYWLYVVEYANFNCQEAYNAELTDDGYHQGGLGNGVTNVSNQQDFNDYYPITPCGYGNDLGNGTGVKLITSPGLAPANGVYMCRWRGFDNPFGDIQTNLDGIIIDADADNHPNNMNYVYTCQDPAKFGDTLTEDYEKVGEEIHQDGYIKLFDLGEAAHIIPNVMGGNTTQYKCDQHLTGGKNKTLRTLFVGGIAYYTANAGLGHFYSVYSVSERSMAIGFRSVSQLVPFQTAEQE